MVANESNPLPPFRPHLDWRAYGIAALGGGLFTLLTGFLISAITLGEPGINLRVAASLFLGPEVIPATADSPLQVYLLGVLVHFLIAALYALLVVLVIHRWGLIVGLIGGALIGLAVYTITIYALSYFIPWIFPLRSWMATLNSLFLGGAIGVIYELFDSYDLPFPHTKSMEC
mgnify:CR=1 FL=1